MGLAWPGPVPVPNLLGLLVLKFEPLAFEGGIGGLFLLFIVLLFERPRGGCDDCYV